MLSTVVVDVIPAADVKLCNREMKCWDYVARTNLTRDNGDSLIQIYI